MIIRVTIVHRSVLHVSCERHATIDRCSVERTDSCSNKTFYIALFFVRYRIRMRSPFVAFVVVDILFAYTSVFLNIQFDCSSINSQWEDLLTIEWDSSLNRQTKKTRKTSHEILCSINWQSIDLTSNHWWYRLQAVRENSSDCHLSLSSVEKEKKHVE
jgi:hypothetical protein